MVVGPPGYGGKVRVLFGERRTRETEVLTSLCVAMSHNYYFVSAMDQLRPVRQAKNLSRGKGSTGRGSSLTSKMIVTYVPDLITCKVEKRPALTQNSPFENEQALELSRREAFGLRAIASACHATTQTPVCRPPPPPREGSRRTRAARKSSPRVQE